MEYQSEGPYRPTKAWVHEECGCRAGRMELNNGSFAYHCPECDVTDSSKVAYGFKEIRING